jgi:hypothetical protein
MFHQPRPRQKTPSRLRFPICGRHRNRFGARVRSGSPRPGVGPDLQPSNSRSPHPTLLPPPVPGNLRCCNHDACRATEGSPMAAFTFAQEFYLNHVDAKQLSGIVAITYFFYQVLASWPSSISGQMPTTLTGSYTVHSNEAHRATPTDMEDAASHKTYCVHSTVPQPTNSQEKNTRKRKGPHIQPRRQPLSSPLLRT